MDIVDTFNVGAGQCVLGSGSDSSPGGDRVRNGHGLQLHRDLYCQQQRLSRTG